MTGSILRKPRGWLVALVAGWFGMFALFPELYRFVGLRHYGVWFLDTFAILASNDAVARGLDPYAANPLDYLGMHLIPLAVESSVAAYGRLPSNSDGVS